MRIKFLARQANLQPANPNPVSAAGERAKRRNGFSSDPDPALLPNFRMSGDRSASCGSVNLS
jgi:hypothetical protein